MNKILITISVVLLIVIGVLFFYESTATYVSDVNENVTALETELAEIDAAIQAGLLTPQEAAEAQTKIITRIEAINSATSASQNVQLTDAQRAQLVEALERLKQVLIKYKTTLVAIDEAVLELPESERPTLSGRNRGGSNRVAVIATETIAEIEVQIEEIIEEVTDEELAEELTDSMSETYVPEEEVSDDSESGQEENDEEMDEVIEASEDEQESATPDSQAEDRVPAS